MIEKGLLERGHRIRAGFERWLRPENFDEKGRQKAKLQVA